MRVSLERAHIWPGVVTRKGARLERDESCRQEVQEKPGAQGHRAAWGSPVSCCQEVRVDETGALTDVGRSRP